MVIGKYQVDTTLAWCECVIMGSLKRMRSNGHSQYILWSRDPPISEDCTRQEKIKLNYICEFCENSLHTNITLFYSITYCFFFGKFLVEIHVWRFSYFLTKMFIYNPVKITHLSLTLLCYVMSLCDVMTSYDVTVWWHDVKLLIWLQHGTARPAPPMLRHFHDVIFSWFHLLFIVERQGISKFVFPVV